MHEGGFFGSRTITADRNAVDALIGSRIRLRRKCTGLVPGEARGRAGAKLSAGTEIRAGATSGQRLPTGADRPYSGS